MKISDLLIKDRIKLDVQSTNKVDVIKELAKLHEKTGVLKDYDGYVKALMTPVFSCNVASSFIMSTLFVDFTSRFILSLISKSDIFIFIPSLLILFFKFIFVFNIIKPL